MGQSDFIPAGRHLNRHGVDLLRVPSSPALTRPLAVLAFQEETHILSVLLVWESSMLRRRLQIPSAASLQIPSAASTAALCQPGSWSGASDCRPVQKLAPASPTARQSRSRLRLAWARITPPVEDFPPLFDQLLDLEDEYGGGRPRGGS